MSLPIEYVDALRDALADAEVLAHEERRLHGRKVQRAYRVRAALESVVGYFNRMPTPGPEPLVSKPEPIVDEGLVLDGRARA